MQPYKKLTCPFSNKKCGLDESNRNKINKVGLMNQAPTTNQALTTKK